MDNPNESEAGQYKKEGRCALCGDGYVDWGHNPEPLLSFRERVCGFCNRDKVIPARLKQ